MQCSAHIPNPTRLSKRSHIDTHNSHLITISLCLPAGYNLSAIHAGAFLSLKLNLGVKVVLPPETKTS